MAGPTSCRFTDAMLRNANNGASATCSLSSSCRASPRRRASSRASQDGAWRSVSSAADRRSNLSPSPAISGLPVPPRSAMSSIVSAARRTVARSRPRPSSGCFSSARMPTGSPGRKAVSSKRRSSVAGAVRASGSPPESSARMPKRSSSADTRRARLRSLVTSAAVLSPGAMARRKAIAIATASSRSFAASTSVTCSSASATPASGKEPRPAIHASVVSAGRSASLTNRERKASGCDGLPISTISARRSPNLRSSLARPNCGWPSTDGSGAVSAITDHVSSSISRSRPGSTTAPFGNRAITDSNSAVAGTEPVEPAAMTGPFNGTCFRRAASAWINALRCVAGLERSRSFRSSGHAAVTISRKSSVTCHQLARSPETRSPSLDQSEPSVSISSINAARSRASQIESAAEAGTTTSSSNSAATWAGSRLFQARTKGASNNRRSIAAMGGAMSSIAPPPGSNSTSSSSNSPSARIVGRMAERPP